MDELEAITVKLVQAIGPSAAEEMARLIAKYMFECLWRSGAMDARDACMWLHASFDVSSIDELTLDECERLVDEIARFWEKRNKEREDK